MTKEEWYKFHNDFFTRGCNLSRKKNEDYCAGDDPFSNFKQVEILTGGGVSAEAGLITRMSDKMSRLGSFVKNGKFEVTDESVQDTLLDITNYAALFAGLLEDKNEEKQ